jgi:hypothetical protein
MTVPKAKVEFGLTQSGGDYVFQDLTAWVREVDITRGISRIMDYFTSGNVTIILDNNQGFFDPGYFSSPFYGQVAPTGAVRISSNGVVIYRGLIQTWSFANAIYGDHTATITAADALSLMAQKILPDTYFGSRYTGRRVNEVLDLVGWSSGTAWRSIDAGNDKMTYDYVQNGTDAMSYFNAIGDTEFGRVYADRLGRINFRDSAGGTITSRTWTRKNYCLNPNFETGTSAWTNVTRSSAIAAYKGTWSARATTQITDPLLGVLAYGFGYYDTNSALYSANKGLAISGFFRSPSVGGTAYIDAALINSTTGATVTQTQFVVPVTAGTTWYRGGGTLFANDTVDTLSMFVNLAGTSTYLDCVLIENSGYIDTYFDGSYTDETNPAYSVSNAWDGTSYNSTSTQTIVETVATHTPSSARLTDTAGGTSYSALEFVYGSENTYGTVYLTSNTFGTSVGTASNPTLYGGRTLNLTYLGSNGTAQNNKAAQYGSAYGQPDYRVNTITVPLEAYGSAAITPLLNMDIWDNLTVAYTPPWSTAISSTQRIIGIDHTITPAQHSMTFHLSQIVP